TEQNMSSSSGLPKYHVALSPNGLNVITFNTETLELEICHTNNLTDKKKIKYRGFRTVDISNPRLCWSIAISNSVNLGTHSDTLIGVSCFDRTDTLIKSSKKRRARKSGSYFSSSFSSMKDLEEGHLDYFNVRVSPYTWILSTWYADRIKTSVDDTGGVIRFLADDSPNTDVVVVHVQGISRTTIESNYADGGSLRTDLLKKPAEQFLFPMLIATEIGTAESSNPNLQLFNRNIEKNFFVAENYKFELLEMYSLKTGELYKTFHIKEETIEKKLEAHGNAIYEVSKNDALLAYCRGNNSVSIYLMENTLEIATKLFSNLYRINTIDFVHDDEKLFLIGEEEKDKDDGSTELVTVILIWNLFSDYEDCVQTIRDTQNIIQTGKHFSRFTEHYHKFSSASGFIVGVNEDTGEVFSIVDHPDLKYVLEPFVSSELIPLEIQRDVSTPSPINQVYHYIYKDGKFVDARKEPKNTIIIGNAEPWVRLKKHPRTSAYLNDDKTLQVIMGLTTIQVWRKNESSKYRRRLEYIWTSGRDEVFDLQSFHIGNGEFSVELSLPIAKETYKIHWPRECSPLRDACRAIEYLNRQQGEPVTPNKKQLYRDLSRQTKNILKRFMNKHPDVWRMADVRYEIMQSLIRGQCVSLIKAILFNKDDKDENPRGISSKLSNQLHYPRLYEWPLKPKESDLQVAISSSGDRRQDTIIVGYLLSYYADNAMNNAGWMFTVTQALPELYDHNMDYYVHELFYKPCFGAKEIKIDTSFISRGDLFEGRFKPVHSLYIKPGLKRKPATKQHDRKAQLIHRIKSFFSYARLVEEVEEFEETLKEEKIGYFKGENREPLVPTTTTVRVVPLPGAIEDNTKVPLSRKILKLLFWPREYIVTKDEMCSPFLRVIGRDSSPALFNNPAMAAVIDYKWASAREYSLRQFARFIVFALLFSIITSIMKDGMYLKSNVNFGLYLITQLIFFYLGYYLLLTEIVQLKHEGSSSKQAYSIFLAFITLFMWGEFFLMLRFFKHPNQIGLTPGGSSYSILNASDTNTETNNLFPDMTISQSIDVNSVSDNYFSHFWKSVESVFFWINGRWDQLDQWDFIPLDILAIIASIFLVIIMQNLLIALMTNAFEEAQSSGEDAVLRHRADLIADFETLQKPLGMTRKDKRYIYYIGKVDDQTDWLEKAKEYRSTHNALLGEESNAALQVKVQGIENKLEK
ncbi:24992_t:CDS:10, partial [Dentiscutata erythropus]